MSKVVLNQLDGREIYMTKISAYCGKLVGGQIRSATINEASCEVGDNVRMDWEKTGGYITTVDISLIGETDTSCRSMDLRTWNNLCENGWCKYGEDYYATSREILDRVETYVCRDIVIRKLDTISWDTRAWQLTCQLFAQSWNVLAEEEKKMKTCVEYAYKLIDIFKEKATEVGVNRLKETLNNSNN